MSNAPIFIVGPARSGTTLTARILGRHSRIFTGGENHFFEEIYSRRRTLGDPRDEITKKRILERLATMYQRHDQLADQERMTRFLNDAESKARLLACETYPDILTAVMEMQLEPTGKKRWVNHTPKDVFHVKEILSFYPDARFLVCVRDVRDYLLSYKNQWRNKAPEQLDRLKDLYHPVVTSLVWKSTVRRIPRLREIVPHGNLMVVRYETLVTDTEKTVREICEVAGEDFEADMLNVDTHNSSHARNETGIFTTSVGNWRGHLDEEEVYLAQRLNRKELENLEYRRDETSARTWRLVKYLWTFPVALWRAVQANANHRGPLLPYLNRRARAFLGG